VGEWGSGALFSRFRQIQSGFVPLPRPEFLSLCVPKEKGTKEKGHPDAALSGLLPSEFVRRGRAFRPGILPGRKGVAIPGNARCAAFSSTPHRSIGAPVKQRAPSAQKQEQQPEQGDSKAKGARSAARLGALSSQIRRGVAATSIV
jgi:hypothetical protein